MQRFSQVNYPLVSLVEAVDTGELGLPELQRPFVWGRAQVRDLFDSLYRGYPTGHFLFWRTGADHAAKVIGTETKQSPPAKVIVDGQQRLTSLYSVTKGRPVIDEDFNKSTIRIAFRPRTKQFEVANSASDRDPEWLSDIATIWNAQEGVFALINSFIDELADMRGLSDAEKKNAAEALNRLHQLNMYQFTAIELSSELGVEQVSDVFVRVNSKGTPLNQADFILTLMSVHWDDGRRQLEDFARTSKVPSPGAASPFNYILRPSPDQLLRVSVGLGLRRGRLSAVYQLLRGRHVDTGEESEVVREQQFERLKHAQTELLDLVNWHEFLRCIQQAGYRSNSMITSDNNVVFSYLAYLIGRVDFGMTHAQLRPLVARWFFMTALTGRYTGTPETQVEKDLRRFDAAQSADEYVALLDQIIHTNFTSDFWAVTLPDMLASSSAYSPALFAYHASLNLLNARALFSPLRVSELLDPTVSSKRSPVDRHHLFPRSYLQESGISSTTRINQIANYALVEWPDNVSISSQSPLDYFPHLLEERVPPSERDQVMFWHALPDEWYELEYEDFLARRRGLIAKVIRAAFERLRDTSHDELPIAEGAWPTLSDLVASEESATVEFKSSARYSYREGVPERVINHSVLKTIAAFLNTDGGTLVIGVDDDGEVLGIEPDLQLKNHDLDGYANWLTTFIQHNLGTTAATKSRIRFESTHGRVVCLVDVERSPKPIFVQADAKTEQFFVRMNNTTRELRMSEIHDYIQDRWES